LILAPAFVLVRLAARFFGGCVARDLVAPPEVRTPRLARGQLAQGGLAVVMAVNYTQVRPDLSPRLILTVTFLSALLFEIAAERDGAAMVETLEASPPDPVPARAESVSAVLFRRGLSRAGEVVVR